MTTRRQFLTGLLSVSVAGSIPVSILSQPAEADWQIAIGKVLSEYITEFTCFGTAGLRYTETYPFLELIRAKDIILIPELSRSFGDF